MLAKLRSRIHRPSPAMVVAMISLFVGLGGTSFAAVTLKKNSVLSKHIKDGQVTTKDVKNSSLLANDFRPGQLPPGARGEQGPKGDDGAPGANGAQGPPGLSGYERVQSAGPTAFNASPKTARADCPSGKKVISAGIATFTIGQAAKPPVESNVQLDWDREGASVLAVAPDADNFSFWAYAICAHVAP